MDPNPLDKSTRAAVAKVRMIPLSSIC
jgi:hypothetical protein